MSPSPLGHHIHTHARKDSHPLLKAAVHLLGNIVDIQRGSGNNFSKDGKDNKDDDGEDDSDSDSDHDDDDDDDEGDHDNGGGNDDKGPKGHVSQGLPSPSPVPPAPHFPAPHFPAPSPSPPGEDGDTRPPATVRPGSGSPATDTTLSDPPSPTALADSTPDSLSPGTSPKPGTTPTDASSTPSLPTPVVASISTSPGAKDLGQNPGPSFSPSPPSSPSPSTTSLGATSRSPNGGAIAGGVIGALLFLALLIAAVVFVRRRRRNRTAPSAEFLSNPSAYPFARAGFGNTVGVGGLWKTYGGSDKVTAGRVAFKGLSTDSGQQMLSEKGENPPLGLGVPNPPPMPKVEVGEILYSTPVPGPAPGSAPGTPTSPNGRRIPFGTGTFQFPPTQGQPQ